MGAVIHINKINTINGMKQPHGEIVVILGYKGQQ